MNSLMKSLYYCRTQQCRNGAKKDKPNSRGVPIACWLQRKLCFLLGNYLKCNPDYDGLELVLTVVVVERKKKSGTAGSKKVAVCFIDHYIVYRAHAP